MGEISSQMEQWTKKATKALNDYDNAHERCREEKNQLNKLRHEESATREAIEIAQAIAQEIQQTVHNRIASVVSRCLETVFEEPYEFKIWFERKRGRTEARLVFERGGLEVDPMTASGGGVVDVAAFALRISCILLARPKLRRVLILDEPFKSPSHHYRERVRDLINSLADEMGVQFIIVTNIEELETGTIIDLGG